MIRRPLVRLNLAVTVVLAVGLLAAAPAVAADGVGLWGRTDDKVITLWAFAIIAFFPILVTVLTVVQSRRERRKQERRDALAQLRR